MIGVEENHFKPVYLSDRQWRIVYEIFMSGTPGRDVKMSELNAIISALWAVISSPSKEEKR